MEGYRRPAVAGSGTIACGLAAIASTKGDIVLLARSEESAGRAQEKLSVDCAKLEGADPDRLRVTTDPAELADCDLVVESIIEEPDPKARLLAEIGEAAATADLATTTSSLAVAELGERSGHPSRVFGLHVFNPVPRMELVELCFPDAVPPEVRGRAEAWCRALGKTPVEVPDQAGFVVNRLLFPYLFDAVRLLERTGMGAEEVDSCMTLGAGHPMGPLAVLDFVGLDVAQAIGEALHRDTGDAAHRPPGLLIEMVGAGKLGRKSGAGFHRYG